MRGAFVLVLFAGFLVGCQPRSALPAKAEVVRAEGLPTAKGELVGVLQAGGNSGAQSAEFQLMGSEQRIDWTVTSDADPPLSIIMTRRADEFGISRENLFFVPRVPKGTRRGSERVLLPPGTWSISVDCQSGWNVQIFDMRTPKDTPQSSSPKPGP